MMTIDDLRQPVSTFLRFWTPEISTDFVTHHVDEEDDYQRLHISYTSEEGDEIPAFLFLHIASVIMMVGGIFARQIVRAVAKKSDDVKAVASLTHVAHRLDTTMVIPGSNLVMLFGIVVAILLKWPIFGFLQGSPKNWLLVSNLLLVMSIILVPMIFLPHSKRVEASLQTAVVQGRVTPELRTLLEDQTNQWAHYAEQVIVLIIAALMVLKPF